MEPFDTAPLDRLCKVLLVLTDVDDTLTLDGRLPPETLSALARLREAGIKVVPATAASAGWGSLMAHMWPVDAVIAENGGVVFDGTTRHLLATDAPARLPALAARLAELHPWLEPADDQPYRETCLAYRRRASTEDNLAFLDSLAGLGAGGTVNSLWLLAWPGERDKRRASALVLPRLFGLELDRDADAILYSGDSENDQPMFEALDNTVGVSTVVLHALSHWPRWITKRPGGLGFVEIAERLVAARR